MKHSEPADAIDERWNECLARTGLRSTPQRRHVYSVLLERCDHPTADEVYMDVKHAMPEISLATVYNCLDTLVQCGLVRQVIHERGATRYCSNTQEHHHFYCDKCRGTYDIAPEAPLGNLPLKVPPGFKVRHFEIVVQGLCPKCGAQQHWPGEQADFEL